MGKLIYWIVLVAILAEVAAVAVLGGAPAAAMIQSDIGIGLDVGIVTFVALLVAFIANRMTAYFFPVWHRRPSEWRAQQQHWQQPDRYRGGQ